MLIHFVHKLPEDISGFYAHYHHRRIGSRKWTYCDLRAHIYLKQDEWLLDLEKWHSEISRVYLNQTRFWWFFPSSRLIAFQPPIFKSFFFALALIEYCESNSIQEIYLVDCPKVVSVYLKELHPQFLFDEASLFSGESGFSIREKIFSKIREHGRICKTLISLVIRFLKRNRGQKKFPEIKIVVYSHMLNSKYLDEKGDHFFGKMMDEIPGIIREQVLWFYYPEKKGIQQCYRNYYQSQEFSYAEIFDFLQWSDLKNIFGYVFSSRRKITNPNILPPLKISSFQSSEFQKVFLREAIKNFIPVDEFAVFCGFKRLLKKIKPTGIVYPYEEKGFERAILFACDESQQDICSMGFAHPIYNKGLMYVRNKKNGLMNNPQPTKILTTGTAMKKWFVNWGQRDADKVDIIGSPRYHTQSLKPHRLLDKKRSLRVLFLTGLKHESGMLANYLEENGDVFQNCDVLIRPYLFSWAKNQEEGIQRISKIITNFKVEYGPIQDQFAWCDIAVYSSTSAGIEAMLFGRLTINVNLHDELDLNPFSGKGDLSELIYCSNPAELKAMLGKIRTMNEKEYADAVHKQRSFAREIFAPMNSEYFAQFS